MKKILFIIMIASGFAGYSQVGVGTTSPDSSAQLDVVSANKGILIPRVQLKGSSDAATIANPKESLLVYNTQTVSDVVPGFYYWNNVKWVALASGGGGLSGTVGILNGGTGATTPLGALTNLGAQSVSNLTTVLGSTSDHYPSENAVRIYVDNETLRATGVEGDLQKAIDLKASATDIASAVDFETNRAKSVEKTLQDDLDTRPTAGEITVLTSSVNLLADKVEEEKGRAILAESTLEREINVKATVKNVEDAVKVETDRATAKELELKDAVEAKATLKNVEDAVKVETDRATAKELELKDAVEAKATLKNVEDAVKVETDRATAKELELKDAVEAKATVKNVEDAVKVETDRATAKELELKDAVEAKATVKNVDDAVKVETDRATAKEVELKDALDEKEVLANKSSVINTQTDDTKYPSVKAVKAYVDANPSFYGADGTLSAVRTVNQNNNNLTFTTGALGSVIIDGNLKKNGPVYSKFEVVNAANYTVPDNINTIVYTGGAAATFTMPPASLYPGMEIKIWNVTNNPIGFPTGTFSPGTSNATVFSGTGAILFSDGSIWYLLLGAL
jgi:hypothetical protein